ncbi:tyrosine-type recombinase/integrase [Nocardia beijingensis]|uniref:tyrosine-type recombinase/integrase n=1 Tax=Nocardia beijingensis TaxID=95162 RepID=UPI0033BBC6A6
MFPTQSGGRISSQLFHNKCWRPTLEKVADKIGKRPRPHDLRHTCASWMINGAELTDVQGHLAHEKITTTVVVYGHLDRRSGKRASTAVSKALGRAKRREKLEGTDWYVLPPRIFHCVLNNNCALPVEV